ncbi:MAG: hypothetical protein ACRC9Y_09505 [Aeromonas veronii]
MNVNQMKTALLNAPEFLQTANMLAEMSGAKGVTQGHLEFVAEWTARNGNKKKFETLVQNVSLIAAGIETILAIGASRPNYYNLWKEVWSNVIPYSVWLSIHTIIVLETIAIKDQMHSIQQAKTATIQ